MIIVLLQCISGSQDLLEQFVNLRFRHSRRRRFCFSSSPFQEKPPQGTQVVQYAMACFYMLFQIFQFV